MGVDHATSSIKAIEHLVNTAPSSTGMQAKKWSMRARISMCKKAGRGRSCIIRRACGSQAYQSASRSSGRSESV